MAAISSPSVYYERSPFAKNELVVLPAQIYGTAGPARTLGLDLERIKRRFRNRFPDIVVRLRSGSGYAKSQPHRVCEQLGEQYSSGQGMNHVMKQHSDELLEIAVQQYEATDPRQRLLQNSDTRREREFFDDK
jgi:hypothetical protein